MPSTLLAGGQSQRRRLEAEVEKATQRDRLEAEVEKPKRGNKGGQKEGNKGDGSKSKGGKGKST